MVLRHADVETTRKFYIQPKQQCAEAGMRKFAGVLKKQYGVSKKKKGL
jgi:hypothetical protein